jgi:hypothetical protein
MENIRGHRQLLASHHLQYGPMPKQSAGWFLLRVQLKESKNAIQEQSKKQQLILRKHSQNLFS